MTKYLAAGALAILASASYAGQADAAVVYCKTVGVPKGCVMRPTGTVVVTPTTTVVTPATTVVTPVVKPVVRPVRRTVIVR